MSEPQDEFVEGDEIQWSGRSGVAGLIFGAGVTAISVAIAEFIGLIAFGFNSASSALWGFYGTLLATPLEAGTAAMVGIWEAGASGLTILGPLAFPAAVGISAASIMIFIWGAFWAIRRFAS